MVLGSREKKVKVEGHFRVSEKKTHITYSITEITKQKPYVPWSKKKRFIGDGHPTFNDGILIIGI